jgi:hypothetical protein
MRSSSDFATCYVVAGYFGLWTALCSCALPRDRVETFGAGDAGSPTIDAGKSEQALPTLPAAMSGSMATAPRGSSTGTGGGGAAPTAAQDAGSITEPPAGGAASPSRLDAAVAANLDECGQAFSDCIFANPGNFQSCARKFCRALDPGTTTAVASATADSGVNELAACAMMLAECVSRSPNDTAGCMAKYQACMM